MFQDQLPRNTQCKLSWYLGWERYSLLSAILLGINLSAAIQQILQLKEWKTTLADIVDTCGDIQKVAMWMIIIGGLHLLSLFSLAVLRDRSVSLQDKSTLICKIAAIVCVVGGSLTAIVLSGIMCSLLVDMHTHTSTELQFDTTRTNTLQYCPSSTSFFFINCCILICLVTFSSFFHITATIWIMYQRAVFLVPPPGIWDDPEEMKALNWIQTDTGDVIPTIYMLPPSVHRQHREVSLCLLYSHGNAMDLADTVYTLRALAETFDCAVMGYEYPGYGLLSPGHSCVSEERCYSAIRAAFNCVTEYHKLSPRQIVLFGRSLGTGPSTHFASLQGSALGGVILQSPLTSVLRTVLPIDRFSSLPFDMFCSIDKISQIKCPTFIMHGRLDRMVPFEHGEQLWAALTPPYNHPPLWLDQASHNDMPRPWIVQEEQMPGESEEEFQDKLRRNKESRQFITKCREFLQVIRANRDALDAADQVVRAEKQRLAAEQARRDAEDRQLEMDLALIHQLEHGGDLPPHLQARLDGSVGGGGAVVNPASIELQEIEMAALHSHDPALNLLSGGANGIGSNANGGASSPGAGSGGGGAALSNAAASSSSSGLTSSSSHPHHPSINGLHHFNNGPVTIHTFLKDPPPSSSSSSGHHSQRPSHGGGLGASNNLPTTNHLKYANAPKGVPKLAEALGIDAAAHATTTSSSSSADTSNVTNGTDNHAVGNGASSSTTAKDDLPPNLPRAPSSKKPSTIQTGPSVQPLHNRTGSNGTTTGGKFTNDHLLSVHHAIPSQSPAASSGNSTIHSSSHNALHGDKDSMLHLSAPVSQVMSRAGGDPDLDPDLLEDGVSSLVPLGHRGLSGGDTESPDASRRPSLTENMLSLNREAYYGHGVSVLSNERPERETSQIGSIYYPTRISEREEAMYSSHARTNTTSALYQHSRHATDASQLGSGGGAAVAATARDSRSDGGRNERREREHRDRDRGIDRSVVLAERDMSRLEIESSRIGDISSMSRDPTARAYRERADSRYIWDSTTHHGVNASSQNGATTERERERDRERGDRDRYTLQPENSLISRVGQDTQTKLHSVAVRRDGRARGVGSSSPHSISRSISLSNSMASPSSYYAHIPLTVYQQPTTNQPQVASSAASKDGNSSATASSNESKEPSVTVLVHPIVEVVSSFGPSSLPPHADTNGTNGTVALVANEKVPRMDDSFIAALTQPSTERVLQQQLAQANDATNAAAASSNTNEEKKE